jgi:hypothetical protein
MMQMVTRGTTGIFLQRRSESMAKRNRTTFQKHAKEQARQQKQRDKAARRLEAKQRRATAGPESGDIPEDVSPGETYEAVRNDGAGEQNISL